MEKGKQEKRAYIVALTGLASRRDRDLAEECGFDNFLTKPISFKRIGELLRGLSEKGS
jgi:DNA-binding response OmpR family regulator